MYLQMSDNSCMWQIKVDFITQLGCTAPDQFLNKIVFSDEINEVLPTFVVTPKLKYR